MRNHPSSSVSLLLVLTATGLALLPACGAAPADGGMPGDGTGTGGTTGGPPDTNTGGSGGSGQAALTLTVTGQGSTLPAPGSHSFPVGTRVSIDAVPADGWRFAGWRGDEDSPQASVTVLLDGDRSVTAEFEPELTGAVPRYHLPWAPGRTLTTGQANNGVISHPGRFAWDYTLPVGTPVVAAAAGRVLMTVDDIPNNPEGQQGSPDDPANMIMIDHGDGLVSLYAHLDEGGAAVVPGQLVARGQFIGYTGNSGYSTGPHLHYEVIDAVGRSVSTGFQEMSGNDGIPTEGDVVTSQNELSPGSVDTYVDSTLPTDVFAENGLELVEPTPPAFFYTTGTEYTVSGRTLDHATHVCVALLAPDGGDTEYCDPVPVEADGRFTIDYRFPDSLAGLHYLGIISGTGGVAGLAPVPVWIAPPPPGNEPPVAVAVQPADNEIDFGGTGVLDGSESFDPEGDPLAHRWTQVSGPPARIADPAVPSTTFTLDVGEGIVRVAFQLLVFDGSTYSLPARVEYRMIDNFHVLGIGVTDAECDSRKTCESVTSSVVSASAGSLQLWVDLLNVVEGDTGRYEVYDPSGERVLTGDGDPAEQSSTGSFGWITWTGTNLTPVSGSWRAVYYRNGIEEASTTFTVTP